MTMHRFESFRGRLDRQTPQDVVGLVAGVLEERDPVGPEDFLQFGDLDGQIVGHGLAVGLVVLIDFLADFRSGRVENDSQMPRAGLVQELAEGDEESVNRVGRETAGRREPLDGVIRPVKQGIPVDEIKGFAGHRQDLRRWASRRPSATSSRTAWCWSRTRRFNRSSRSGSSRGS